jgi:UDP-2,3-diacylglucosamine pyrophosphatase LpxH
MYELDRITQVMKASETIPFDDTSRIVFISDCHRGDGSWADDFARNQNTYYAALSHYFSDNYTYIELGDGDELWKNQCMLYIMEEHLDVFRQISRFIKAGRFYSLYGNHDWIKKNWGFIRKKDYQRRGITESDYHHIFEGSRPAEGLILLHQPSGGKILLIHGHQADFFNDRLMSVSKFLVRYLWRPLEILGVNNPTSPAKNNKKTSDIDDIMMQWVMKEKMMLIAGHTHRPVFPEAGKPPYFNDGSCVHPYGITCIEITDGTIALVKWGVKTRNDGILYVGRDVIAGPNNIMDYLRDFT